MPEFRRRGKEFFDLGAIRQLSPVPLECKTKRVFDIAFLGKRLG